MLAEMEILEIHVSCMKLVWAFVVNKSMVTLEAVTY